MRRLALPMFVALILIGVHAPAPAANHLSPSKAEYEPYGFR